MAKSHDRNGLAKSIPLWSDPTIKTLEYFQKNPGIFHGKLIIDTDCGSDDAIAILFALAHQDVFDILAITAVNGNTFLKNVIINVLKTLRVVDSKIPVYAGADKSILDTPPTDYFFGQDGLGDVPCSSPPTTHDVEKENAVNTLVRLVKQYPGEVTIIALGPLTNIALATRLDPTFRSNVKAIVWTGGSVKGVGNARSGVEFNAYIDPASNYIVFNTTGPPVVMCPWELFAASDITFKWREEVLGKIDSPIIKFINGVEKLANKKLKDRGVNWIGCDSVTTSVAVDASIVTEIDYVHVEPVYSGEFTKGAFMVDYRGRSGRVKNAIIVQKINFEMYKDYLIKDFS